MTLKLKFLKNKDYMGIHGPHTHKIAITDLWHAMDLQTICHLIVKDKVAEQHIL